VKYCASGASCARNAFGICCIDTDQLYICVHCATLYDSESWGRHVDANRGWDYKGTKIVGKPHIEFDVSGQFTVAHCISM
jgi:hypothetical protein